MALRWWRFGRAASLMMFLCKGKIQSIATRSGDPASSDGGDLGYSDAATFWKVSTAFSAHICMSTFSLAASFAGVPSCVSFGVNSP